MLTFGTLRAFLTSNLFQIIKKYGRETSEVSRKKMTKPNKMERGTLWSRLVLYVMFEKKRNRSLTLCTNLMRFRGDRLVEQTEQKPAHFNFSLKAKQDGNVSSLYFRLKERKVLQE